MEGFDADDQGRPQKLTFRRYERYAAGGCGIIWFEATAVVPEGRSNPGQLHISDSTVTTFRQLVRHTKKTAEADYDSAEFADNPELMEQGKME